MTLSCTYLLSYLQALSWCYRHQHWTAKGDPYYGDHLLYQRLYESVDEEIDALAEKIQGSLEDLDVLNQARVMLSIVESTPNTGNPSKDMLVAELAFQKLIRKVYEHMKTNNTLSLGMDDFLMSMASEHETNMYLLRQRTRTASSGLPTEIRRKIEVGFQWGLDFFPGSSIEFKGMTLEVRVPMKSGRDIERLMRAGPKPMEDVLLEVLDTSEYTVGSSDVLGDVYVISFKKFDPEEDGSF